MFLRVLRSVLGFSVPLLVLCAVACGDAQEGDAAAAGTAGSPVAGAGDGAPGGAGADAAGSGGSGAVSGGAAANDLLRVSTTHIEFDSRNDEYVAVIEVEALRGGVTLSTSVDNGGAGVVSEVDITGSGALARVHVTRGSHLRLNPGVYEAEVELRGCAGGACQDVVVDVTYTVVHLELEGYPSSISQDIGYRPEIIRLRRRIDEDLPEPLLVPIKQSNGDAFEWTAEVDYGDGYEGPEWLIVKPSGSSADPLELSTEMLFEAPSSRSTELNVHTGELDLIVTVYYETLLPLEVSTHALAFHAKVGEEPEPQRVRVFDAAGDSYPWHVRDGSFNFGCPNRDGYRIELVEGSYDALPAEFTVTVPASPEPTSESTPCRTKIEVKHISTTTLVHQSIELTLDVTE